MAFDNDVFISYTHIDNKPSGEGQQGWIAMFAEALDTRLGQLLGEDPRIWRDRKLGGNDRFDQEIIDQLVRAAVLVSVLSPRYLKSEWCNRELHTFCELAEQSGGLYVDNKSRIFKLLKTPIDREPDEAKGLLGYPFYKEEPESGRWREFNRAVGKDLEREFWVVLDDLAQDSKKLLEMLRTGRSVEPTGATVVYVVATEPPTLFWLLPLLYVVSGLAAFAVRWGLSSLRERLGFRRPASLVLGGIVVIDLVFAASLWWAPEQPRMLWVASALFVSLGPVLSVLDVLFWA